MIGLTGLALKHNVDRFLASFFSTARGAFSTTGFRLQPLHLAGYLRPERGRFELTALPGGRTRLEGTSWYRNEMWPAAYWRQWSDPIIHRIHRRVFEHIKTLAEQEARVP